MPAIRIEHSSNEAAKKVSISEGTAYKEALKDDNQNFNVTYPYSDKWDFKTFLERINLDKQRADDIKMGRGFIISEPQGIKKDIKNQDGIFSARYGSNSITDVDSFNGAYRCKCGALRGSIRLGEWCPDCQSFVKYVGDDIGMTGYLVLKDKYWIIHPNIYRTLEGFIGATRLARIIEPIIDINSDGRIIENVPKKKDEPFKGIGILEFRERFKEIMDFYLAKNKNKQDYYDDIMEQYKMGNVFTHTVSVYSSLLRPSKLDEGSLRYEACNDQFQMLASLVYKCNRDRLKMDQKPKEKLGILFDIQTNLNDVYFEIKEILARKRGDIRSAIGGRYAFSSRSVIKQDVSLECDQVKLPFHGLIELLQQVIINILHRSYSFTFADAYKKWYKAQITGKDQVVYDIIEGLIHDSDGGLPILINRNPTISYGGILFMRCIGINMNYTMSIPLYVLKPLAADFDGDTLNILYLYNKDFIREAEHTISPRVMFISRNDGKCNADMLPARDQLIIGNSLRSVPAEYTEEEIRAIREAQAYVG